MTHDYNISPAIEHYGCMVDILSRAGLLEEALELIRRMTIEPDSIIWGASLGGCKLHGNLEIAQVSMEKLMNLEPDSNGYYVLLGSSWIEMDEKVHDFVASNESHHLCSEIYMMLSELSGNLEFADYENKLGVI
ncbi:hypothetical protein GIB67_040262 [Kingdonia uniflora]|uniref:Pentatricopeptide repeat-containing protein n=1 Tax=Kingdonia uniflora TaxID=39325 RepID=A0A7J7MVM9_9MAGN|nr:hypothetical protein GIB67_040262 [Kingdonia uniflora]